MYFKLILEPLQQRSHEFVLVLASVCQSVFTSVTNFSWNLFFFFFRNSAQQQNYKNKKLTETDFPGKIPVYLKITKQDQKRIEKWSFLTIEKLLEVTKSESKSCSLFPCARPISEKIMGHKLQAKMLSPNQIVRFFDHQDLRK